MRLATRLFLSHALAVALGVSLSLGLLFVGVRAALVENQRKVEREQLDNFVLAAHESALDKKKTGLRRFMKRTCWDNTVVLAVYDQPKPKLQIGEPEDRLKEGQVLLEHFEGQT